MATKTEKKPCWACEQGYHKSPYTGSHGFSIAGLGMVDTTCPVTKEAVEKIEAAARDIVKEDVSDG